MKVYLVQWVRPLFDMLAARVPCDDRTIYGTSLPPRIVQAFGQRAAAESFRAECEAIRNPPAIVGNPFYLADGEDLSNLTSLPDNILGDWMREVGLEPPPVAPPRPDKRGGHLPALPRRWAWAAWWHDGCQRMSIPQRSQVYRALDKVDFLEIVELELEQ